MNNKTYVKRDTIMIHEADFVKRVDTHCEFIMKFTHKIASWVYNFTLI